MASFDVVVKTDLQEVDNAVNQARKEIAQRYDFRGSKSEIQWDHDKELTLVSEDDYRLKAVLDVLQSKLVRRGVSLRNLSTGEPVDSAGGMRRQTVTVQQGIPQEKAKEIVRQVKEMKRKVQSQIQGDQVRVTGKKRDDLQAVIQELREADFDLDLQFINYRD